MPRIQQVDVSRSVIRGGSVGRQRIDAPREAFGGGRGLQALGQGVSAVGGAASRIGASQDRQAAIDKREKDRASAEDAEQERKNNQAAVDFRNKLQAKNNASDFMSGKARAANIYNKAAILAQRATSSEEVDKAYTEAGIEVAKLSEGMRSDDAKSLFGAWKDGESDNRSNQFLSISLGVNDRVSRAQDQVTVQELTTSAIDSGSLANNKANLMQLWGVKDISQAEKELNITRDLRATDSNYANKLLLDIDESVDSSSDMQRKLDIYESFVDTANSLEETDKRKLKQNVKLYNGRVKQKQATEIVELEVAEVMPPTQEQADFYKTTEGQTKQIEIAENNVDTRYADLTGEERAGIKSRINSMLGQSHARFNRERNLTIDDYLKQPDRPFDTIAGSDFFSSSEQAAMQRAYSNRIKTEAVLKNRSTINQDMATFEYNENNNSAYLNMLIRAETLPTASERSVYKELLQGKKDASEKGEDYRGAYSDLERIVNSRLKLTSEDINKDKDVSGIGDDLTPEQRAFHKNSIMRQLRALGESDEFKNNSAGFNRAATELLDVERQQNVNQKTLDLYKEVSE